MKNKSLVSDYYLRGTIRLAALQVLFDKGGWADVVREAQEIVELVGKALCRFLGSEPARVHDVSAQLVELKGRVSEADRRGLEQLIETSKELRRDRELAFYGAEDLTPSEFYTKKDAERAFGFAQQAVQFVGKMIKK